MTVYLSRAQLDKPVKAAWGGVTCPFGIAVNSVGEIIVVENATHILVLDKEGKKLRSIECSQHMINWIHAIAVDNGDNIYFIGNSNTLGKSNRYCDKLQVVEVQQVKGPGCIGTVVVGDEVMVTEYNNEGQTLVYDRELKYVRQITGRSKTRLRHLHPACHGNLYISSDDKNIQVLSKTGNYLCSFGIEHLKDSWMVHVSSLYVADSPLCDHIRLLWRYLCKSRWTTIYL